MEREFADRSATLFGRGPDLAHLLRRAQSKGVTAVVGPPQMGKTWLLTELARQLSEPPFSYLVGFHESVGEASEYVMLRALVDLYTRWLSDSTWRQRAAVVWQQQKKDLITKVPKAVGATFEKLAKIGPKHVEVIGSLVKEAFDELAKTNQEMRTGGLQLPQLQIDQIRELLFLVSQVTRRSEPISLLSVHPMVLVLARWENSLATGVETNILDAFMRQVDDWPFLHVFVGIGLQTDEQLQSRVEKLRQSGPETVYDLPPMHLDAPESQSRLIQYVRKQFPAAAEIKEDKELLDMISGFPGTLDRWSKSSRIASADVLREIANDAHAYRFRDLEEALSALSDAERSLAIRVGALPSIGNEENWKVLRDVVLQGTAPRTLDALKRAKVLESHPPPTYGHMKRVETALRFLGKEYREDVRAEHESLIFQLASRVRRIGLEEVTFLNCLASFVRDASDLELSAFAQALSQSALSLFGLINTDPGMLLEASDMCMRDGSKAAVAALLAAGFVNKANFCPANLLVDSLRKFAETYGENGPVREYLGLSAYNAMCSAQREGDLKSRDELLNQLRKLHYRYAADTSVVTSLARSIFNALTFSIEQGASAERDQFLEELRQVVAQEPEAREQLAAALVNTFTDAKERGALQLRDELLEELRQMNRKYPGDLIIREYLARALYKALSDTKEENTLGRVSELLSELRRVVQHCPVDDGALKWWAKALAVALLYAHDEGQSQQRDELLDELRRLARDYPDDSSVREMLATILFSTININRADPLSFSEEYLNELRQLSRSYPDDAAVFTMLANFLVHALHSAIQQGACKQAEELLDELRLLCREHPRDDAVRNFLGQALCGTLDSILHKRNSEQCDLFLNELRQLSGEYQEDSAAREWLAKALIITAKRTRDKLPSYCEKLIAEVHTLVGSHPEESALQEIASWLQL